MQMECSRKTFVMSRKQALVLTYRLKSRPLGSRSRPANQLCISMRIVSLQAEGEMITMQKQSLEAAEWKDKELRAELASLGLLLDDEGQKCKTVSSQLSQLKEHSGMDQVCSCSASQTTLPLCLQTDHHVFVVNINPLACEAVTRACTDV